MTGLIKRLPVNLFGEHILVEDKTQFKFNTEREADSFQLCSDRRILHDHILQLGKVEYTKDRKIWIEDVQMMLDARQWHLDQLYRRDIVLSADLQILCSWLNVEAKMSLRSMRQFSKDRSHIIVDNCADIINQFLQRYES